MPPRNNSGKNRSKIRGRPATRSSPPTNENPLNTNLPAQPALSPSHVGKGPQSKQNEASTTEQLVKEKVSKYTTPPVTKNNTHHEITSPASQSNNSKDSYLDWSKDTAALSLSDNRDSSIQPSNSQFENGKMIHNHNNNSDKTPTPSEESWHAVYSELKEIRKRMATLDEVEIKTNKLSQQVQSISDKTGQLESKVDSNASKTFNRIHSLEGRVNSLQDNLQKQDNTSRVQSLEEEVASLRDTVKKQGELIAEVQKLKENFSSASNGLMVEMKDLVETQRGQVDSFNQSAQVIKQEVTREVKAIRDETEESVSQLSSDIAYDSLRDKAFKNRYNLVLLGLEENESLSSYAVVRQFFKNVLKVGRVDIENAYRMGSHIDSNSSYIRPLLVQFARLPDRNRVWRKRKNIPNEEEGSIVRIQADLPRQLRADIQLLYRITRVASTIPEYRGTVVRNYALLFKGKEYTAQHLDKLPEPLRPTTIAVSKSDHAIAFFSKYSPLSNHHPSQFMVEDNTFQNMEQFLAYKRAIISDDNSAVQRALELTDPVEAKAILNSLKQDHIQEWENNRSNMAEQGLRAKFEQNKHLSDFLLSTQNLQIGEASPNKVWGVGMTLENKNILDTSKWPASGNLLGKLLMKIRNELQQR